MDLKLNTIWIFWIIIWQSFVCKIFSHSDKILRENITLKNNKNYLKKNTISGSTTLAFSFAGSTITRSFKPSVLPVYGQKNMCFFSNTINNGNIIAEKLLKKNSTTQNHEDLK